MRHPPSTAAQLSFFAQPPSWKALSLRGGLLLSSARICLHWWMDLDFFLGHILEYFLSFLLVYIKKLYGFAKGCEIGSMFFLSFVDRDTHPA